MNIVERGKAFIKELRERANGDEWYWKVCPHCGSTLTTKYGFYKRQPWGLDGRETTPVQRHQCKACKRTYAELPPELKQGSWYKREVHRAAIDHWQHGGFSMRRTAEMIRSWIGHQERWLLWHPLAKRDRDRSSLSASTVHRWLDAAGASAEESVPEQLAEIGEAQELGTDGLWARLKGKVERVVLMAVDSVSGLIYPPVVVENEKEAASWGELFTRLEQAGLDLQKVRGICSDGAHGLLHYLREEVTWIQQQRCVWHIWHGLRDALAEAARQASQGLTGDMAKTVRKQVRSELVKLVRGIIDAQDAAAGEAALLELKAHAYGQAIASRLNKVMDRLFVYQMEYCRGLQRVSPEWYWRDFRQRLSHGRNHRSQQRLERAALLWAVYHNFQPAQWRSEKQRHYRFPGKCALQVAGVPPGNISYLDALGV